MGGSGKKLGECWISRRVPLILGIFLCIFRFLQQERIHLGAFERGNPPIYAYGEDPLVAKRSNSLGHSDPNL